MVNAFWLDEDVERAAAWLVDDHVTSSVFECAMVLTTAAMENGYPESDELYHTHAAHPLTRWAGASLANWRRLRAYAAAAHEEWRRRWDHGPDEHHGSWAVVEGLDEAILEGLDWPDRGADGSPGATDPAAATDPPQVTDGWAADHYVDAYRYYYANEKRHLFRWSGGRTAPPWLPAYAVVGAFDRDGEDGG